MADEPLGRMVIELGLDDAGLGKGLQGARKAVKSSMTEMKASMAVIGQTGSKFDVLSAKSSGLAKTILAQRGEVNELGKAYKNSLVDGKPTAQTAKLASQFNNASAKLAALNKQYIANARAAAEVKVQTTGITGAMNTVGNGAIKVGRSVSGVGDTMTKRVTAPIALGFAAAGKAAISFNSQIDAMGPLLTNGGAVTAKYRAQLDQMASSSKKWAVQYGVSTTEINNGMSELVKRGFTTNQVLGSMPSILDATKASGEDMGTVMNATASIVEQFGLKTNSTAGTMKNTQMVTDSLTYAANATAAGFGDMSEAFSYVGPQANAAGMSVQQTAAAIGELSNKGIEGQKAGTALRSILTSLVKVTPNASKAFTSMGISASDLKKDSNDLPALIDDITEGTKGWTKADKNKAIATAFGKENQSAMNALLETGSGKLRDLTKATEDSGGATKKVAEDMMKTPAERLKRLQQQFEVTGISLGEKLMPYIEKGMSAISDLADAFGKLSPGMQDFVVKLGISAAAAGPLLSVFGRLTSGSGKVLTGIVKLASKLAGMSAAKTAASELDNVATSAVTTGEKVSGAGVKAAGGAKGFSIFGKALTTGGQGAGVLGSALTPLGATIIGVGAAVAVGAVIWEGWGKEAVASANRTSQWGTDVGAAADKSLDKMSEFSGNATTALETWSGNSEGSTKKVSSAFNDMYQKINEDAENSNKKIDEHLKSLPTSVAAIVKKSAEAQKKQNTDTVAQAKQTTENVNNIVKTAGNEHRSLTDDENTYIANSQRELNRQEVSLLGISSKQKKTVIAALNGDVTNMTKKQRTSTITALQNSFSKEYMLYGKQKKTVTDMYKTGEISADTYHKALNQLADDHTKKTDTMAESIFKLGKANGESATEIDIDLQAVGSSYDKVAAKIKKQSKSAKDSTGVLAKETGNMSKSASKAAAEWNKIVLDPKTGKVKTNAQEEVTKAAATEGGWNKIEYALKNAKLTTNAKEMVANAALENGKWDDLTWEEQEALIKTNAGEKMDDILESNGQWDNLSWQQKAAIVNANTKGEVAAAMLDNGQWNNLTWKQQEALIQTNAGKTATEALMAKGRWDGLSLETKQAIVKSNSKAEVAQAIISAGEWNNLAFDDQEALVTNKASKPIMEALNDAGKWDDLSIEAKQAIVTAKGKDELIAAINQFGLWNQIPVKEQIAAIKTEGVQDVATALDKVGLWDGLDPATKNLVATSNAPDVALKAIGGVDGFNKLPVNIKNLLANDANFAQVLRNAGVDLSQFNITNPAVKNLLANDFNLSQTLQNAGIELVDFNSNNPDTKKLLGDNAQLATILQNAGVDLNNFDANNPAIKNLLGVDFSLSQTLQDAGIELTNFNSNDPATKQLLADNTQLASILQNAGIDLNNFDSNNPAIKNFLGVDNVTGAANNANAAVTNSNLVFPLPKEFNGTAFGATNAANQTTSSVNATNGVNPNSKDYKGNSNGAVNAGNQTQSSVNTTNGTGTTPKFYFGDATPAVIAAGQVQTSVKTANGAKPKKKDYKADASNALSESEKAQGAISSWNAAKVVTHFFNSIFTEEHKKKAKGTNDFEGGTMMVNDQAGPMFRELVQFPTGETFVPHGRNVVFNAPKHTKVVPAGKTNRLLGGIPQFAKGTGGIPENADYLQDARKMTMMLVQQAPQIDDTKIVNSINQTNSGLAAMLQNAQQQAQVMQQQNEIIGTFMNLFASAGISDQLKAIAAKNLQVDGSSFSKQMAPFNSVNQVQRSNFADRGLSIDQSI